MISYLGGLVVIASHKGRAHADYKPTCRVDPPTLPSITHPAYPLASIQPLFMAQSLRAKTKSSAGRSRAFGQECIELLNPTLLVDDIALENTMYNVEILLSNPEIQKNEFLVSLESIPHLLEFLLSRTSVTRCEYLSAHLCCSRHQSCIRGLG